jgi:hypothetical protein
MPRFSRFAAITALSLLFVPAMQSVLAQEFFCNASVNYGQLSGNDYSYLRDLETELESYFNDRTWTDDRFLEEERIECNLQVTFLEAVTLTSFRTSLVVSTRRPVYGTTQSLTIVSINDSEWRFDYAQGTPLIFDLDRYNSLTSVLDFYAYLILGYDYDTFSELGGTPYFQRARQIADKAQSLNAPGWSPLGNDRSRGGLISQLQEPRFQPLRQAYFDYHFNGVDKFIIRPEEARASVLDVLTSLQDLYDQVSRSYVMDLFFMTKSDELKSIFLDSPLAGQAYDVLTSVDPANLASYDEMIK